MLGRIVPSHRFCIVFGIMKPRKWQEYFVIHPEMQLITWTSQLYPNHMEDVPFRGQRQTVVRSEQSCATSWFGILVWKSCKCCWWKLPFSVISFNIPPPESRWVVLANWKGLENERLIDERNKPIQLRVFGFYYGSCGLRTDTSGEGIPRTLSLESDICCNLRLINIWCDVTCESQKLTYRFGCGGNVDDVLVLVEALVFTCALPVAYDLRHFGSLWRNKLQGHDYNTALQTPDI